MEMVSHYAAAPRAASFGRSAAWVALVALSIGSDFLMFPIVAVIGDSGPPHPGIVLVFAVVGCALAQCNVLAAWLVWCEGPFLRRLAIHWAIAAGLCCIWLVGVGLTVDRRQFVDVGGTIALTVPLVSWRPSFRCGSCGTSFAGAWCGRKQKCQ